MPFRLAALALVAVALVAGLSSHRRHSSCSAAATRLFLAGAKKAHPREAAVQADIGTVTKSCHDSTRLAAVSGALKAGGRDVQAARVAERAVALAPRDYVAWLAVANAEARSAPARARAAEREVRRLNPRRMSRAPARRRPADPPAASQALAALARSVAAGP
jgi:hypothetical protein